MSDADRAALTRWNDTAVAPVGPQTAGFVQRDQGAAGQCQVTDFHMRGQHDGVERCGQFGEALRHGGLRARRAGLCQAGLRRLVLGAGADLPVHR